MDKLFSSTTNITQQIKLPKIQSVQYVQTAQQVQSISEADRQRIQDFAEEEEIENIRIEIDNILINEMSDNNLTTFQERSFIGQTSNTTPSNFDLNSLYKNPNQVIKIHKYIITLLYKNDKYS